MKQLIVLIATVLLGVVIATIVLNFSKPAKTLSTNANTAIDTINTKYTNSLSGL